MIAAVLFVAVVRPLGRRRRWRPGATPVAARPDPPEEGMYAWSLGPPPAVPNPDRAVDEDIARMLRGR